MKKILAFLLLFVILAGLLPVSVMAVTTIDSLTITNVPTPRPGGQIPAAVTVNTTGARQDSLFWYDVTAGNYVYAGSAYFTEGHVYRMELWVEAKDGYEFAYTNSYTTKVSATVNGKKATVSKAYEYNAWAMVVVSYTFEPCQYNTIQYLEVQLPGITYENNVLHATEGEYIPYELQAKSADVSLYPDLNASRYHPYGFRWNDTTNNILQYKGDRFKGGRDYYVHIALKPNGGFFTDDLVVVVNGKQATLKAKGQDYVEVGVEVTCFGTIYGFDINPVVILPKDGNTPDYKNPYYSTAKLSYAAVTGWYDVQTGKRLTSDDKFVGGKQYRVEVEMMASYPYRFEKNAGGKMTDSPMVTGQEVDSYQFGYDSYRGRQTITLSKTFTAETPDHTCTMGPWQCDDGAHSSYCPTCGKKQSGGAHWSSGKATCAKGQVCDVCGYEFTKPTENHTPDTSKWVARAEIYHYHACAICGAHCDIEDHRWSPTYLYQDENGHAWICADCKALSTVEPHVAGPAGTPDAEVVCKDCGYIMAPAQNHIHQLTRVEAVMPTCTREGSVAHYTCSGCELLFADKDGKQTLTDSISLPALKHTPADAWSWDDEAHWKCCTQCGGQIEETRQAHSVDTGTCTVCGWEQTPGEPAQPTEPVVPSAPVEVPIPEGVGPTQAPSGDGGNGSSPENAWLIVGFVALVCFGAAVTATVIILKKKKN